MGDGFAAIPTDGVIKAPFSGKVELVFPTKHAIGLKSTSGVEVLIHIGINTVELNGNYFDLAVKAGDDIKRGKESEVWILKASSLKAMIQPRSL